MSKPVIALIVLLCILSHHASAQLPLPERRSLNIGVAAGLGGASYSYFPSVDMSYRTTSLRVSPGFRDMSVGVAQEILPISEVYYQWKWVGSFYYIRSKYDGTWPGVGTFIFSSEDAHRFAALTGLKLLFGSRFYSYLQVGVIHSRYEGVNRERDGAFLSREAYGEWMPYLEFSIGINFFRNYSKEIEYAD
ncbi:hypothetical protein RCC89_07870 [Cytophagaceae bacterium ABcell3]|nr:hypothetical protein RCC89_07870 [Cytophagaceae bacterium ABcell3]